MHRGSQYHSNICSLSRFGPPPQLSCIPLVPPLHQRTIATLFPPQPRTKVFNRLAGYVEQMDVLLETVTVRELFTYTAQLKLPQALSTAAKVLCAVAVAMGVIGW
jgi:hypothetical protein